MSHPRITLLLGLICSLVVAAFSALARDVPENSPPPGYLVVTGWYKDLGVQKIYTEKMSALIKTHGLEASLIGMPGINLRVLEGDWTPRLTIVAKFPSGNHVKKFWWSDAYRELAKLRAENSLLDVVKIDGVAGRAPQMSGKNAYLMFYGQVEDRKKFVEEYAPFAYKLVQQFGGVYMIRAGRWETELLEGNWPNVSFVVIEFPNPEAMTAFWTSDEYRRLSRIRISTGKWSVVEIVPKAALSH